MAASRTSSRVGTYPVTKKEDVIIIESGQPSNSLAEAFLKRKLLKQTDSKKELPAKPRIIDQVPEPEPTDRTENRVKIGKTKEELAEIRKQMMKRRPTSS